MRVRLVAPSCWWMLACMLATTNANAQCALEWQSAGGYCGANAIAYAAIDWDPDGPGPTSERAVVGGAFTVIGDAVANRIAVYDPVADHWSPLGGGMNGSVRALLGMPNGDLIAAGSFTNAGGVAAANIARWDGVGWSSLGSGTNGAVLALAHLQNGDIVAGGQFGIAGGVAVPYLARWDGVAWSALGGGTAGPVLALALGPTGDLFAGGDFLLAGAAQANHVARWSNSTWSGIGGGCDGQVRALAVLPTGALVVAGAFTQAGGVAAANVAQWSGTAWSAMNAGIGPVQIGQSLRVLPNGTLWLGTQGFSSVYQWLGSSWQSLLSVVGGTLGPAGPTSVIHAICGLPNGERLVVGDFRGTYPVYGNSVRSSSSSTATGSSRWGAPICIPTPCGTRARRTSWTEAPTSAPSR